MSSCLHVSEASRTLLDAYGGSLTSVHLSYGAFKSAGRLAALLRRPKKLTKIVMNKQEALPALSQAIAQGCCREIDTLSLCEEGSALD